MALAGNIPVSLLTERLECVLISFVAGRSTGGPGFVVIFTAFACIAALMMPLHGDAGSSLPDYLHLTVNQKLIAAYVLGRYKGT